MRAGGPSGTDVGESDSRLLVVGGGPKAIALAAKAHVLSKMGLAQIEVMVFEEHEIGAHWTGDYGFTDGKQLLGTPPEKDLGFPYVGEFGPEVEREMLRYSWQAYQVHLGKYGDWIDHGKRHPSHREWASYLSWAAEATGVKARIGKVNRIGIKSGRVVAWVQTNDSAERVEGDGVVLTGPGESKQLGVPGGGWNDDIIDGRTFWRQRAIFKSLGHGRVALIGGGETAASIILWLLDSNPDLEIDVINRHGAIFTRGESYQENTRFTDPGEWKELSSVLREEFIVRTDRGVFSLEATRKIDASNRVQLVTGEVKSVTPKGRLWTVNLRRASRVFNMEYDKIIVAVGFDPEALLGLLDSSIRFAFDRKEQLGNIDEFLRIPYDKNPANDRYYYHNIHVPMLAGMAQGPGFPNLSCLGLLSDRILRKYVPRSFQTLTASLRMTRRFPRSQP